LFAEAVKPSISSLSIFKGFPINHLLLVSMLFAALSLTACDKSTVVTELATPAAVHGPPGPQGATGSRGEMGYQGETGKTGDATTVIALPQDASAPAN
jgi:hypothetical protein